MKRAFSEGLARGTKIYGYYKVLSAWIQRGAVDEDGRPAAAAAASSSNPLVMSCRMDRNSSGRRQPASTKDGRGCFRRAVRPREVRARALARQRAGRSQGGKSRKQRCHASETSQTFGLPSSSYHLAPLSNLLAGHQIWVRRFPQEKKVGLLPFSETVRCRVLHQVSGFDYFK